MKVTRGPKGTIKARTVSDFSLGHGSAEGSRYVLLSLIQNTEEGETEFPVLLTSMQAHVLARGLVSQAEAIENGRQDQGLQH